MLIRRVLLTSALLFSTGVSSQLAANESLRVNDLVVILIDAVDVPASESGVIAEFFTREGIEVTAGQPLATLDDRQAQLQEELAQVHLEIARQKINQALATELAEKRLAQQQQLAKEHEISCEIADREAANEVRILASKKSAEVAKNELDRALQARREFVDSVSQSEIDGLRLAYERSKLETLQADFERQIDSLQAKLQSEAAVSHKLEIDRSRIELHQALSQHHVEELQVQVVAHQAKLAKLARAQHKIVSPLDGVVVERFRKVGDWCAAGDPVVRVVRLSRLRAEGFASSDALSTLRQHPQVSLQIRISENEYVERSGSIVFVSPEIDPVNDQVRFWVEFDNPELDILPGMRLNLSSKS